jgi:hypothetical protein
MIGRLNRAKQSGKNLIWFKSGIHDMTEINKWLAENTIEFEISYPQFIRKYKDGSKEKKETGWIVIKWTTQNKK